MFLHFTSCTKLSVQGTPDSYGSGFQEIVLPTLHILHSPLEGNIHPIWQCLAFLVLFKKENSKCALETSGRLAAEDFLQLSQQELCGTSFQIMIIFHSAAVESIPLWPLMRQGPQGSAEKTTSSMTQKHKWETLAKTWAKQCSRNVDTKTNLDTTRDILQCEF